jgi:hypothetical protein
VRGSHPVGCRPIGVGAGEGSAGRWLEGAEDIVLAAAAVADLLIVHSAGWTRLPPCPTGRPTAQRVPETGMSSHPGIKADGSDNNEEIPDREVVFLDTERHPAAI